MPRRHVIFLLFCIALPLPCGGAEPSFLEPPTISRGFAFTPAVTSAYRLFLGQEIPNPTGESPKPDRIRAELWYAADGVWTRIWSDEDVKKMFVDLPFYPGVQVAFMDAAENVMLRDCLTGDTHSTGIHATVFTVRPDAPGSETANDWKGEHFYYEQYSLDMLGTQIAPFEVSAETPVFTAQGGKYADGSLLFTRLDIRLPKLKEKERPKRKFELRTKMKRRLLPPKTFVSDISMTSQLLPPRVVMLVRIPARRIAELQGIIGSTTTGKDFETGSIVVMLSNLPLPVRDLN